MDPLAKAHAEAADLITQAAELVRKAAILLSGTGWSGMLADDASELHMTARRVRDYDPTSD